MIRAAQVSDLDAMIDTEQQAYTHPWSRQVMEGYLKKGGCAWILEQNDEVVGHAVLQVVAAAEAELLTLAVRPQYQGQGFGKQLITYLVQHAEQQKAQQIFLEVRESNTAAITLYEHAGFCQIGCRPGYYPSTCHESGREDALVYGLALVSSSDSIFSQLFNLSS